MTKNTFKLILASGSPRRKELMEHLHLPFFVEAFDVEELSIESDPQRYVTELAQKKAEPAFKKYEGNNYIVVSSDTVVVVDQKIIEKPKSREDAKLMLKELSENTHEVFTSVNLVNCLTKEQYCFVKKTEVEFDKLSDVFLEKYLDNADYMDKAGAYAIQSEARQFIKKINGSFTNVMGFPLSDFYHQLYKFLNIKEEELWEFFQ